MKKVFQNQIVVRFVQNIAERVAKVTIKGINGAADAIVEKLVPGYKVECQFTAETDENVNAKNLAEYFMNRFVHWQTLRPLQGLPKMLTSKNIEMEIEVNGAKFNSSIKLTTNLERIQGSTNRAKTLVAGLCLVATAPEFNSPIMMAHTLAHPENAILAKSKMEIDNAGKLKARKEVKKAKVIAPVVAIEAPVEFA